jgi:outer membrane protein assembly factor BamB
VVHQGKILVGTNNNGEFRPAIKGDKGIVLCFDQKTGKLLWQATHDKLPTGRVNDWPEQGICSTALARGNRAYYVSNRAEVICIDLDGFLDGENDGPFTDETYKEKMDGDFVWVFDMIEEVATFPHNLATCSPTADDKRLFVCTSNGVDEGHLNLPAPLAASFIALDLETGELLWERDDPGKSILHGQWSSPAYGVIGGQPMVVFAGGDGWCYAFKPEDGELLWKFDLNPKKSVWVLGGKGTRNAIISTPVIYGDQVFLAVGQDPEHGEGPGHLYCIDGTKRGDITTSGKVWHYGDDDYNRTISTVAIQDGLCYASDLSGFLHCLDVKTGKRIWMHDLFSAIWGSPYVVDGKVYLGNEDGYVLVFEHGREKKLLAENDMGNSVYTTPVASSGGLYVTNRRQLYSLRQGAKMAGATEKAGGD